jgi:chromosome segregation and condensation protein ScpB
VVFVAFLLVSEGRQVKTPAATEITTSACQNSSAKFTGTDNPRHLRALAVLLRRPITRQELDNVAGCSNSPELVAELRRRGLAIKCERIEFIDRDGRKCRPGVYHLPEPSRRAFWAWKKEVAA